MARMNTKNAGEGKGTKAAPRHFLLIKREGVDAQGRRLSATECTKALLDVGVWPLWEHTLNRLAIKAGAKVAIYLSGPGNQKVVATALVDRVALWTRAHEKNYPLILDGIPHSVLQLTDIRLLDQPLPVASRLSKLSFVKTDPETGEPLPKWGVRFMGGARSLNDADFHILTT